MSAAKREQVLNALEGELSRHTGEGRRISANPGDTTEVRHSARSSYYPHRWNLRKLFHWGNRERDKQGDAATLPFFQRALELDPNFDLDYNELDPSDNPKKHQATSLR